jgi:transposase
MPKTRPPYPPQLRAWLIELARTGRTPEELGRQFEPSAQTIRNWLRQADRDDGRRADGLTTEERASCTAPSSSTRGVAASSAGPRRRISEPSWSSTP